MTKFGVCNTTKFGIVLVFLSTFTGSTCTLFLDYFATDYPYITNIIVCLLGTLCLIGSSCLNATGWLRSNA